MGWSATKVNRALKTSGPIYASNPRPATLFKKLVRHTLPEHFLISGDGATFGPGGDIRKLPFVHCLNIRDIRHCSPILLGISCLYPWFGRSTLPSSGGLINWNDSASELELVVLVG